MKTRNGLVLTVSAVVILCLSSTSTWAGSNQQHGWGGVAVGVGSPSGGSARINYHVSGYYGGPPVAFSFNYWNAYRHSPRHRNHWKRPHHRGPSYRGHHRHGNPHGTRHQKNWKSDGRGAYGRQGSHGRDHGGRRR